MENSNVTEKQIQSPLPEYTAQHAEAFIRGLSPRNLIGLRCAISDGFSNDELAVKLNVDAGLIAAVCTLRAWRESTLTASAAQRKADKITAEVWAAHVSAKAQHLAVKALDLTEHQISAGDAKGLANAARGASALVAMARQAERMDKPDAEQGATVDISVFYMPSPRRARELAQAKQVHAIEEGESKADVKDGDDLF